MTLPHVMWRPNPRDAASTAMHRFMQHTRKSLGQDVDTYEALHRFSVHQPNQFWRLLLDFCGVVYQGDPSVTMAHQRMPLAGFFPGVRLNYAENLLKHVNPGVALVSLGEARPKVAYEGAALSRDVQRVANGLRAMGVVSGDRVAGFMPNIAEAIVAMLACTALGAVWSGCSPDFGAQGAVDRFGQIAPKVLFGPNGYVYHGKRFDCRDKLRSIAAGIHSIAHVVVVPLCADIPSELPHTVAKTHPWATLPGDASAPLTYAQVPFEHPLFILYSSGTTGKPKCIVHGTGGTLLQHIKELSLHSDVRPGDNVTYFTTCGWMMWNWLASALQTGAKVTLFDGSPTHAGPASLWDMAAAEGITHFGTSAKYLASCRQNAVQPLALTGKHDLRVIWSTGSPLMPEEFDWVYAQFPRVQLSSISGGTDIISCFVLGNPLLPVYRGEIQCMGLGMQVAAYDDQHKSVPVGTKGELVCLAPFVSMPVSFFNDPNHAQYLQTYFAQAQGVWWHGDTICITGSQGAVGGIIMYGRSDATLKPGGVRIVTAEIYRLVEILDEVEDSVVIGQPMAGDVRVILFVKPKAGQVFDMNLEQKIRTTIRAGATPRHVPAVILPVTKIPYTRSGKKMELAVGEVICGKEAKNTEAMQDATALEDYLALAPRLQAPKA